MLISSCPLGAVKVLHAYRQVNKGENNIDDNIASKDDQPEFGPAHGDQLMVIIIRPKKGNPLRLTLIVPSCLIRGWLLSTG